MQKIHVKPQDHWMNDPNGFIYYKGNYHLFYQCFPYGPWWGRMHWAHVVSKDLVNWEYQGIALFPSKKDDRSGCFSGSAVEADGKLYLYYTGVSYVEENPEDINRCIDENFLSSQLLITSEDGFSFDNIKDKRTVIPVIEDASIGDARHTRDPKVWKEEDGWYMVLGSNTDEKQGKLLLYKSTDRENWQYVNTATKEDFGWMWECPDYFRADGQDVLIFSPMGIMNDGKSDKNQAVCMLVDFDRESCTMELPDTYQFLDYGLDLYAPQSTTDEDGRRVVIAWLRMPKAVEGKWIGMQSIPRVVQVKENHLYFRPHPHIKAAFTKKITSAKEAEGGCLKLDFSLEDGERVNVGGYIICRKGNTVCTDRSAVYQEFPERRTTFSTPELRDGCQLEVYVDSHMIEVFVNDGEYVITNAVYGLSEEVAADSRITIEMYTTE